MVMLSLHVSLSYLLVTIQPHPTNQVTSSHMAAATATLEKKETKLIRGLEDEGLDGPQPLLGLNGPFAALDNDPWEDKKINPCDQLTVASALGALAGRELFSDVTFLVGDGPDKRFVISTTQLSSYHIPS
jgi:hypothetical protein